ncbi:MAG: tRNA (adenosine(37)-N6)-dimethylallyltransferase MiaA [Patescibacteria group bacterium]|nr:tRNA (adenosine(37)-N6)-dimethylallyltransferase MiaA [Patescibacteria group bacterium]
MSKNKSKAVVIAGPTSSGKTKLSLMLAKKFNGVIISADSRQIYNDLNIATAKIKPEEMQGITHYMVDISDITDRFTAAKYQKMARGIMLGIHIQNQKNDTKIIPFIVGGTGLYIKAVVDNYDFKKTVQQDPLPYDFLQIGIDVPREELYDRINKKTEEMVENGLIDETKKLISKGYDFTLSSLSALGYIQIKDYLEGIISLPEAISEMQKLSRNYAKRQLTWFRADKRINWIKDFSEAKELIKVFLS